MAPFMRHAGVISLLMLSGCFHPVIDGPDGGSGGGHAPGGGAATGGGGETATGGGSSEDPCSSDSDCSTGMVCDPCGGVKMCAPGCRNDTDCGGQGLTCQGGVACLTCPCALHYCSVNPCVDTDNDGYVEGFGTCESKPGGDCNDTNAQVHPGAVERCDDGIDNDCNGLIDGQDPACQSQFCPSGATCQDNFDCKLGTSFCEHDPVGVHGCCNACPPTGGACQAGYEVVSSGVDAKTGCPTTACVMVTGVCPQNYSPVCSTHGGTYGNACEAQVAGEQVLHPGECVLGEGIACNPSDHKSCGTSGELYCRDQCPTCDSFDYRCAKTGSCTAPIDCPPTLPTVACGPNRAWTASCTNNACTYGCQ